MRFALYSCTPYAQNYETYETQEHNVLFNRSHREHSTQEHNVLFNRSRSELMQPSGKAGHETVREANMQPKTALPPFPNRGPRD